MDREDNFIIDLDFSRENDLEYELLDFVEKSKENDNEHISFLQKNHPND